MSWQTISNTTVTADGTEQALFNAALTGTLVVDVDTNNMASGDTLVFKVYETVNANLRITYSWSISGAQAVPIWRCPAVPAGGETVKVTIQQTAGVNRAYGYKVMQQ